MGHGTELGNTHVCMSLLSQPLLGWRYLADICLTDLRWWSRNEFLALLDFKIN